MESLLELIKNKEVVRKLSRPLDEAVYTIAVLKKIGGLDISTLNKRILCQKMVYFANRFDISPHYCFNLYIYGPYSPNLANDLFELSDYFKNIPPVEFIAKETDDKFTKLNNLVNAVNKNEQKLEVLATLDFLKTTGLDEKTVKKRTLELKKKTSETDLEILTKHLKKVGLW